MSWFAFAVSVAGHHTFEYNFLYAVHKPDKDFWLVQKGFGQVNLGQAAIIIIFSLHPVYCKILEFMRSKFLSVLSQWQKGFNLTAVVLFTGDFNTTCPF